MTMIDLWSFQQWDTIQNAFNAHGVYTASWSKSIFVGDDNAIKSGYDTDMSTSVNMSDISAIRDQFTPAYEWLSSVMIQCGITPLELEGFTSTTSFNNPQLINTNHASNENTNSYNATNANASSNANANELTSSIIKTNPTTNANAFNGSTTAVNANASASASVFSDGSANNTINYDNAAISAYNDYNDNVNTVSSSDTIMNHSVAPIWFYAKWCKFDKDSFKITEVGGKPDRRLNAFKDSKNDLIHFRIPLERLLLTDFDAWHCVLNDMPCPPASSVSWSDKQWDDWFTASDKWSHERIASSWLNCIITGSDDALLRTLRAKSQPAFIQATCWYIKPEDVIKVYPK